MRYGEGCFPRFLAATAALLLLGVATIPRPAAAAEKSVAQTSFEERKETFIVQMRRKVQALRSQVSTFRRQTGGEGNPKFESAREDFETKAQALMEKLQEVEVLPAQQAKDRKPEIDAAFQAVLASYDGVVAAIK
jgi:hypothetical protein